MPASTLDKIENVVDELQQVAGAGENVAEHVELVCGNGTQAAIVHQLGKPDDAVQRGAQFMRDAGQEAALGLGGAAGGVQSAGQLLILVAQFHGVLLHLARGDGRQVALRDIEQ